MLEFIIENIDVIFAIIVIVAAVASALLNNVKSRVITFIFAAEEKFGPGTGYKKLKEAAKDLRNFFPGVIRRILTEDIYEKIVQNVFTEIKAMIEKEKEKRI